MPDHITQRKTAIADIYSDLAYLLTTCDPEPLERLQGTILEFQQRYPESWRSIQRQRTARDLLNTILVAAGRDEDPS